MKQIDKVSLRAAYDSVVDRTPAYLKLRWPEIFPHDGKYSIEGAPCLWSDGNVKIYVMPSFILILNKDKYAILSPKDLKIIENEEGDMPEDQIVEGADIKSGMLVVGSAWKYANKDGSRDARFKDNFKENIVQYERLEIKTASGLHERFLFAKNGVYIKYALTNYINWFKHFEKIKKTIDNFPSSRTKNGKWKHCIQDDESEQIYYEVDGEDDWLTAFILPKDRSAIYVSFALDRIKVPFTDWTRINIFIDDKSVFSGVVRGFKIRQKDTIADCIWSYEAKSDSVKEWYDYDQDIWKKLLTAKSMTLFVQDSPEYYFLEIEDLERYKEFGYYFPLEGFRELLNVVFPSFA